MLLLFSMHHQWIVLRRAWGWAAHPADFLGLLLDLDKDIDHQNPRQGEDEEGAPLEGKLADGNPQQAESDLNLKFIEHYI